MVPACAFTMPRWAQQWIKKRRVSLFLLFVRGNDFEDLGKRQSQNESPTKAQGKCNPMAIGCTRSRCGRAWFCACVWKFGCGECSRCFRTTVWKPLCKQITTTHDVETDSCLNKHVEPQVGSNNNISCLCRVKTSRSAQSLLEVMIVKICFLLLFGQVAQAKAKVKAKTRAQPKHKATVSVKALDSCSCPSIDERFVLSFKAIHSFSHPCM